MHSPLLMLTYLRFRGWARKLAQSAGTGRGRVFLIIGLVVIASCVLSVAVPHSAKEPGYSMKVRDIAPLAMLGVTVMFCIGSGRKSICFSSAEIDFLFPGPFTRRRLLIYKISTSVIHSALLGIGLCVWQGKQGTSYFGAYIAFVLLLIFSNVASITFSLIREALDAQAFGKAGRVGVMAFWIVCAVGIGTMVYPILQHKAWFSLDALAYVRASLFGQIILYPFDTLALVLTAQHFVSDILLQSGVVMGMIVLMCLLALRLDAYFVEASLAASIQLETKMARAKSGQAFAATTSRSVSRSLPMLPAMGGAGVIAWRQILNAIRCFKGLLIFMCILAVACGPGIYMASRAQGEDSDAHQMGFMLGIGGVWLLIFIPMMLKFDFRSDIENMDVLKSLPISPLAVVTGQIMAPSLVLMVLIVVLLGVVSLVLPAVRPYYLVTLPFLPPGCALLFAAENLVFLIAPTRPDAATTDSVNMVGRSMVMMFVKIGIFMAAGVPAALAGSLGAAVGQGLGLERWQWMSLSGALVWIVLCAATYVVLRYAATLYQQYDPGIHEPA